MEPVDFKIKNMIVAAKGLWRDSVKVSLDLFKVMIPVLIGIKILTELDLIRFLAVPMAPLMELYGLPAQTGLVWATAALNSPYAAIVVFQVLFQNLPPLTVAQMTVLCTLILIAHSLPIEARITQKCGVSFWGQIFLRLMGALLCGALMHLIFSRFGLLTEPSHMLLKLDNEAASLWLWAWQQIVNMGKIFIIILVVMAMMRILNYLRLTDLMIKLLSPVLRFTGIGRKAGTITIIGLVMGIAYGGGLIIQEARSGRLSKADVFASTSLMGQSHGLIEDSLLMSLMGASMYGILWGRLVFSLVFVAILTRLVDRGWRSKTVRPLAGGD